MPPREGSRRKRSALDWHWAACGTNGSVPKHFHDERPAGHAGTRWNAAAGCQGQHPAATAQRSSCPFHHAGFTGNPHAGLETNDGTNRRPALVSRALLITPPGDPPLGHNPEQEQGLGPCHDQAKRNVSGGQRDDAHAVRQHIRAPSPTARRRPMRIAGKAWSTLRIAAAVAAGA